MSSYSSRSSRKAGDLGRAKELGRFILSLQNPDGSFRSGQAIQGNERATRVSLYYPGEAILGLVALHRITGQSQWIESARRGADYLVESQSKRKLLPADAWLMQALEALYEIKPEQRYVEHAVALAETIVAKQYTRDAPPGYAGGFGPGVPRSTPAASRAEGLLAAYRLLQRAKDARAQAIGKSVEASVRFQLAHQFDADNSFFLPNPKRASGGVRGSILSTRIRIDCVQHRVCALLGLAKAL